MSKIALDPMIDRLGTVLDLRERQQALTATNLANADTPGFKAKALDFTETLSEVMSGEMGNPQHGGRPLRMETVEFEAPAWAVNDNSVIPEREMARLKQNAVMYGAVTRGLSRRLAMLKFAASDGQ